MLRDADRVGADQAPYSRAWCRENSQLPQDQSLPAFVLACLRHIHIDSLQAQEALPTAEPTAASGSAPGTAASAPDTKKPRKGGGRWNPAISHLLLELLPSVQASVDEDSSSTAATPPAASPPAPAGSRSDTSATPPATPPQTALPQTPDLPEPLLSQAVELFVVCSESPALARLCVKVAQAFGLRSEHFASTGSAAAASSDGGAASSGPPSSYLVALVQRLLQSKVTYTPAILLAMHFEGARVSGQQQETERGERGEAGITKSAAQRSFKEARPVSGGSVCLQQHARRVLRFPHCLHRRLRVTRRAPTGRPLLDLDSNQPNQPTPTNQPAE